MGVANWVPSSVCFLFILFFFLGCAGYQVGNLVDSGLQGVKTIFVHPPKNLTTEPGLGVALGHALMHRIEEDGRFKLACLSDADAFLEVVIRENYRTPLRSIRESINRTAQYQSRLKADVVLKNRSDVLLLPRRLIEGESVFFVQNDFQESERQGQEDAIGKLADQIVSYLVEQAW